VAVPRSAGSGSITIFYCARWFFPHFPVSSAFRCEKLYGSSAWRLPATEASLTANLSATLPHQALVAVNGFNYLWTVDVAQYIVHWDSTSSSSLQRQ
jgi:hypothetical protein